MKERPILFSAPMVRAILDGRKSQTRRVVKPRPQLTTDTWYPDGGGSGRWMASGPSEATGGTRQTWGWAPCPYGVPGDVLWVRETYRLRLANDNMRPSVAAPLAGSPLIHYEADGNAHGAMGKLRPSIHMPRRSSRITLRVTDVRVERLRDISAADSIAEGVECVTCAAMGQSACQRLGCFASTQAYADLWNHINGPGSWDKNPWVWVVAFERA